MIKHLLILANSGNYQGKREWFYPFKDRFLRRWGIFDGYDKQIITKKCWGCNGTGTYKTCYRCNYLGGCDRCNNYYEGPEGECFRCGGDGIHRVDTNWLERRMFGGVLFHIPVQAWQLPLLIPDPVITYTDIIKHEPVNSGKAWRAAVTLIFLFDIKMASRMAWIIVRNIVKWISRKIRYWWDERRYGEMPFKRRTP